MASELLMSCPWCDGPVILDQQAEMTRLTHMCNLKKSWFTINSRWFDTEAEAITAWNRRTPPTPTVPLPESVRKALDKAAQLADVAGDWNINAVEISGDMVDIFTLRNELRAAIRRLDAQGKEGDDG